MWHLNLQKLACLVVSNRSHPVASHAVHSQNHVARRHLCAVRHSHAAHRNHAVIHAANHAVACFPGCSKSASAATAVIHAARLHSIAVLRYLAVLQLRLLAAACNSASSSQLKNRRPVAFAPVFFRARKTAMKIGWHTVISPCRYVLRWSAANPACVVVASLFPTIHETEEFLQLS